MFLFLLDRLGVGETLTYRIGFEFEMNGYFGNLVLCTIIEMGIIMSFLCNKVYYRRHWSGICDSTIISFEKKKIELLKFEYTCPNFITRKSLHCEHPILLKVYIM